MCGITGAITPNSRALIGEMTGCLGHRGPDDEQVFDFDDLSLGHRRLAILDLSPRGRQPMSTSDGRYTIVFNGEIYNHLDLRRELAHAHHFTSTSDTETLLVGFVHWGAAVLERLNGIFSFAVFDRHERLLTIARDPLGVKPLYYYHKGQVFLFASELKALLAYPALETTLDLKAVSNYLTLLWSPGGRTPLSHVHKLPAGTFLRIRLDKPEDMEVKQYYEIPFSGQYLPGKDEELEEQFEQHLRAAIKRQLLSDVPVGFFLSGGLDSSAIVALARGFMPSQRLKCFTIATGESRDYEGFANDLPYARALSQQNDFELIEVAGGIDIIKSFDEMVYYLDEPQADIAPLHVLNIARAAKASGIKVLLGGVAGDDLLSGYRRHQLLRFEPIFESLPLWVNSSLQWVGKTMPAANPTLRRLKKVLCGMEGDRISRMASSFLWSDTDRVREIFSPDIRFEVEDYEPEAIFKKLLDRIPDEHDPLNQMLFWELKTFLVDHNLNYTDKMCMAAGVEARVPFLDLDLVKFATQIPPRLKRKGSVTKYILRRAMRKYLPKEIINRPKSGFGAPVRTWLKTDLSPLVNERLSLESLKKRGIFDPVAVQRLIQETRSGRTDGSYTILALLAIDSWLRQFVDHH